MPTSPRETGEARTVVGTAGPQTSAERWFPLMQDQATEKRTRSSKGVTRAIEVRPGYWRKALTIDGQRQYAFGFTERECLAEERRLLNEHAQGRSTYRQPKVTLTEFAQRFMDDQARPQRPWSPSTVRAYQQVIDNMLPFLGHYTLQELQDVDVVEQGLEAMLVQMRARRRRPNDDCTVQRNRSRALLSRIFNYAIRLKKQTFIYANPMREVSKLETPNPRARRLPPSPRLAEFRQMLATSDIWHRQLLYTALELTDSCGGLRPGEVLALRWSDFTVDDQGEPIVVIQRHLAGQSTELVDGRKNHALGQDKSVLRNPITPDVLLVVERWRKRVLAQRLQLGRKWRGPSDPGAPEALLFYGYWGTPFGVSRLASTMQDEREKFGLPAHETPHMQRHHWATEVLEDGAPVSMVAEMLGHADPSITLAVYTAATTKGMRKLAEQRAVRRAESRTG